MKSHQTVEVDLFILQYDTEEKIVEWSEYLSGIVSSK